MTDARATPKDRATDAVADGFRISIFKAASHHPALINAITATIYAAEEHARRDERDVVRERAP